MALYTVAQINYVWKMAHKSENGYGEFTRPNSSRRSTGIREYRVFL